MGEITKAIAVGRRFKQDNSMKSLIVGGRSIGWKNDVKYLGIYINRKLTWKKHIEKTAIKCQTRIKKFSVIVGRRSKLHLKTK